MEHDIDEKANDLAREIAVTTGVDPDVEISKFLKIRSLVYWAMYYGAKAQRESIWKVFHGV